MASPLRELAFEIEKLARKHKCWSQIHSHVFVLTDYMKACAFIEENRWREVEDSQRYRLTIDDSKVSVIKKADKEDISECKQTPVRKDQEV
jgi:hypothetical protein